MAVDDLGFIPDAPGSTPSPAPAPPAVRDAAVGNDDFGFIPDQPDLSPVKNYANNNLKSYAAANAPKPPAEGSPAAEQMAAPPPQQKIAHDFLDALEAGWQMSTAGLISRSKLPDTILPEDAPWAHRMASMASTIAGDIPTMFAGGVVGGAAGSEIPLVGTAIGAAYGSWSAPAGLRTALMQHFEKGDIQDAGDFLQRAGAAFMDSVKGGFTGVATEITGGLAGQVLDRVAAPAITQTTGKLATQLATMTTVGKAMEGQMPKAQDFVDGAVLLGAFHGVTAGSEPVAKALSGKMRDIYAKTGLRPEQVVQEAQNDPALMQELLSSNVKIPSKFEPLVEPAQPGQEFIKTEPAQKSVKPPEEFTKTNDVLSSDFSPPVDKLSIELPPEPKGPSEPPVLPPEQQAIRDKWGPSQKQEKPLNLDSAITNAVDDLHPVKIMEQLIAGENPVSSAESPYQSFRRSRGAYGVADNFIKNGPSDFATYKQTGVRGLKEILKPVQKDIAGLNDYLISKGAIDLANRGIETPIPLDAAKEVVKQNSAKYDKILNEVLDFRDSTLKYLKDSGIVSEDAYKAMIEENRRVPFYRVEAGAAGKSSGGRNLSVRNPIKGIKGSTEGTIVDPIESIIKETYQRVTLAERNRALTTLVDLHEANPGSGLMEKVPNKMKPIEVTAEEMQNHLEKKGINVDLEDPMSIFRPKSQQLAKDEIAVFKDGERQVYKVPDQVAEAIKGMDPGSMGLVSKLAAIPAKTLRAGTTIIPDFALRNTFRDQFAAFISSRDGYVPFVSMMEGMSHILRNSEEVQMIKKGGGDIASMVSVDRDYIQNNVFELSQKTGLIDSIQNVVKHPLHLMQVFSELTEQSTRVGEALRVLKGDFSPENIAKAGYAARDITIDFQKIGAKTRAMNSITAFFNAQIGGVAKMVDAFKQDPVGASFKSFAAITAPSIALWWANHDDPRYADIPRWQKDLCWIVMTENHIWRIPKPFEAGIIFGTMPERLLDAAFAKDPNAFKGFGDSVIGGLSPNFIPTALTPIVEKFANKSTFTGGTIIPDRLEKVLPEEQFNNYTSETGKILGKMVASVPGMRTSGWASPMIIDNTVRAWSGNLGKYAVAVADQALYKTGVVPEPVRAATTLADIPFIKAFVVRYPTASSQQVQDFYDNFGESELLVNTANKKLKEGDIEGSFKLRQENALFGNLKNSRESISNLNKAIQSVESNPQISKNDKRQLIDSYYTIMINQAKFANKQMEELKKQLK
jgi:hypothetical protein